MTRGAEVAPGAPTMMPVAAKASPVRIMHELADRIRLRCPLLANPTFNGLYFQAGLENIAGVHTVRINTRAACVVICHDGASQTRAHILAYVDAHHHQDFATGCGEERGLHSVLTLGLHGGLALATLLLPKLWAAPIALTLALPVLGEGLVSLARGGLKVEVLDAAAMGFSLARRDYATAASICFILSCGEYLEGISEDRSTGLLKSLLKPQVETVWLERDGHELELPLSEVVLGDRVIFGPGEMIALDGLVLSGEALVNASSITGESLPLHAAPGARVLSGSVVEEGRIVIQAEQVGAATSMARITAFLENSLRNESGSQQRDNRPADRLVPLTFGLGLAILLITRDFRKAASVLSVDYSCAIKLANPVAVRVAMYTAARKGVLLKGAQAIDLLARVDTVIFDKTGTLTQGRLQVTELLPQAGYQENDLLALAAGAEEHYDHPAAPSINQPAGCAASRGTARM